MITPALREALTKQGEEKGDCDLGKQVIMNWKQH